LTSRPDRAIPGSCRHAGIASGIYDPWGTRSPPRRVGALILDASVLIGLLDREDPHHNRAVDEVEAANGAERELMAPASASSEALVAFARVDRLADASEAIGAMGLTVAPLSARIAQDAAMLRASQSSLRLPDAIVLATANVLEGELLTYDEKLERVARAQRGPHANAPMNVVDNSRAVSIIHARQPSLCTFVLEIRHFRR
jgi:toxin FitB